MNKTKGLFFKYAGLLPGKSMNTLISTSVIEAIFPFYHVVSDASLPHIKHLYAYPSVNTFRSDLDGILKHFEPVHPDELVAAKKKSSKRKFLLSFDDGFAEMHDIVAPILKQKGVPALFFINSGFIDNQDLFYRCKVSLLADTCTEKETAFKKHLLQMKYADRELIDAYAKERDVDFHHFLAMQKPYLTTEQIKQMSAEGFVFGGHSIDHPLYSAISADEQLRQTMESTRFVQQVTGQKKNYFAFPFTGDGASRIVQETVLADEQLNVRYLFGTAGLRRNEGKLLERIPMEIKGMNAENILRNEFRYYSLKKRFGR